MLFPTSKKCRARMVERLTSDGVAEVAAHQMAWASFPFDDSKRPRSRTLGKAVRSESWTYLRESKGLGYDFASRLATSFLSRWADMARHFNEPYYNTLYRNLASGNITTTD